jgi:hypothetical protein
LTRAAAPRYRARVAFVRVEIVFLTRTPAQAGFGIPLLAASHDLPGPRVRSYASLDEAEDDGLTLAAFPWIHRKLTAAFAQSPAVTRVLVGRRDLPPTQTLLLSPILYGEGHVYQIPIEDEVAEYEVQPGDALADVATGIAAAVEALTGPVSGTVTGVTQVEIECTTAGRVLQVSADPLTVGLLEDVTADPGIATDLSAIRAEDETWYGLLLDSSSPAEVLAAAGWAETRTVLGVGDVPDGNAVLSGTTDDAGSAAKALLRDRFAVFFTRQQVGFAYDASFLSRMLAFGAPGSANWAWKDLAGVAAYELKGGEVDVLEDKRYNFYVTESGLPITMPGILPSGKYLDDRHGIDWVQARIRERLVALLASTPKLDFSLASREQARSAVQEVLDQAVENKIFEAGAEALPVPEPDDADRAGRLLPGVDFEARTAGAANKIDVRGSVRI